MSAAGVSEATFYTWKKKYADFGVSELRKLKQLEEQRAARLRTGAAARVDVVRQESCARPKRDAPTHSRVSERMDASEI